MAAFVKAISATRHDRHAPAFRLIPRAKYVDSDTDSFKTSQAGKWDKSAYYITISTDMYDT